jgi:hypothetical protein
MTAMDDSTISSLRPAQPKRRAGGAPEPEHQPAAAASPELLARIDELHDVVWAMVDNLAAIKAEVEAVAPAVLDRIAGLEAQLAKLTVKPATAKAPRAAKPKPSEAPAAPAKRTRTRRSEPGEATD